MDKLVLAYEAKPWRITQEWGVHRPDLYKQFGFEDHNGTDIAPGNNSEVRAPLDFVVTQVLWQPNGGGNVIGILSQNEYTHPDGKPANVQIDYMHNSKITLKAGDKGSKGDLLCLAGSTGFSSGPHTHIRYKWVRRKLSRWIDVDRNAAQNTFDPTRYYNGDFAADISRLKLTISLLTQVINLYKRLRGV